MLWILFCVDKPDSGALRQQHLDTHRAYLGDNAHRLFFTGPQMTDDGDRQVGSVFILKADSRALAQVFLEGEALYRAGVFESVTISRIRRGRLNVELSDG